MEVLDELFQCIVCLETIYSQQGVPVIALQHLNLQQSETFFKLILETSCLVTTDGKKGKKILPQEFRIK